MLLNWLATTAPDVVRSERSPRPATTPQPGSSFGTKHGRKDPDRPVEALLVEQLPDGETGNLSPNGTASAAWRSEILLVDDDPEVRKTLADFLTETGHRCRVVDNGPDALALLEHHHPQLLLLDFAMPGMNGAEVATRALQLRPDLKLLFITGYSDSDAIDKAVDGRARVLKKPVSAAQLAAAIREMLD